jgi:hypothetical protein
MDTAANVELTQLLSVARFVYLWADNIIVWGDASVVDHVCLNDWGSARAPGLMCNTVGTNPVYRCPELGYRFEAVGGGQTAEFEYGPVSDLRALFLSLLAFGLQPRLHGAEELPGRLPWERRIGTMQAVKSASMSVRQDEVFWHHNSYRPQAARLLTPLRHLLFLTHPTPPLSQLYAAFEQLGGSSDDPSSPPAAESLAAIPEDRAAASASASVAPAAAAAALPSAGIGNLRTCSCCAASELCRDTSKCGCVRRGRGCSAGCACSGQGGKPCVNPNQQPLAQHA